MSISGGPCRVFWCLKWRVLLLQQIAEAQVSNRHHACSFRRLVPTHFPHTHFIWYLRTRTEHISSSYERRRRREC